MSEENSMDIAEGKYQAKPTVSGIVRTPNGHLQYAIECAIEVPVENAPPRIVLLTKFQNLADQGMEYAEQDARNCGCDTSKEIQDWTVDTTKTVTVVVDKSEYNGKIQTRLKSIYSNDREGGFLIKKLAINVDESANEVLGLNERMAALRALRAQNSGQVQSHAAPQGHAPASNGAKPAQKAPAAAAAPKAKVPF